MKTLKNNGHKKTQVKLSESCFNDFFKKDDVLNMSDEVIDQVFSGIYDNLLKEAVYPHLSKTSVNTKTQ